MKERQKRQKEESTVGLGRQPTADEKASQPPRPRRTEAQHRLQPSGHRQTDSSTQPRKHHPPSPPSHHTRAHGSTLILQLAAKKSTLSSCPGCNNPRRDGIGSPAATEPTEMNDTSATSRFWPERLPALAPARLHSFLPISFCLAVGLAAGGSFLDAVLHHRFMRCPFCLNC